MPPQIETRLSDGGISGGVKVPPMWGCSPAGGPRRKSEVKEDAPTDVRRHRPQPLSTRPGGLRTSDSVLIASLAMNLGPKRPSNGVGASATPTLIFAAGFSRGAADSARSRRSRGAKSKRLTYRTTNGEVTGAAT
jgi:hypothetical protein